MSQNFSDAQISQQDNRDANGRYKDAPASAEAEGGTNALSANVPGTNEINEELRSAAEGLSNYFDVRDGYVDITEKNDGTFRVTAMHAKIKTVGGKDYRHENRPNAATSLNSRISQGTLKVMSENFDMRTLKSGSFGKAPVALVQHGTAAQADPYDPEVPAPVAGSKRAEVILNLKQYDFDPEDPETALSDALSDLRHWAESRNIDMEDVLDRSARMYHDEKRNPYL